MDGVGLNLRRVVASAALSFLCALASGQEGPFPPPLGPIPAGPIPAGPPLALPLAEPIPAPRAVIAPPNAPPIGADAAETIAPGRREKPLALVEFRDETLADALRLFSEQTGINLVASAEASKVKVSMFLKNVTPSAALDALTKSHGLYYRRDPQSGIIRIFTTQEYQRDLLSFRDERTQVFTLL